MIRQSNFALGQMGVEWSRNDSVDHKCKTDPWEVGEEEIGYHFKPPKASFIETYTGLGIFDINANCSLRARMHGTLYNFYLLGRERF